MKVVFLCSSDSSNQIFIDTLRKKKLEFKVFVEVNNKYRNKLIKKRFRKRNLFQKSFFLIDLISLLIYKFVIRRFLRSELNLKPLHIEEENISQIDDINSLDFYRKIKLFKPDIIIVRGTSIIKEPLISLPVDYFLNIHGSIVPNYRNVHGQFWSFYFDDFENMGTSILHIKKGIDNGNIATSANLLDKPKNLKELNLQTITISNDLLNEILEKVIAGKQLDSVTQDKSLKPFYGQTPVLNDFIKLFLFKRKIR